MTAPTTTTPQTIVAANEHILMAVLVIPVVVLTVENAVIDILATAVAVVGLVAGVLRARRSVRGRDWEAAGIVQRLATLLAWALVVVAAVVGDPTSLTLSGAADLLVGIVLAVMIAAFVVIELVRSGSWILDRLTARRGRS